jgi:hypothetical protein
MDGLSYWREKAAEYYRLAEEFKDSTAMALALTKLADAYSAAAAGKGSLWVKKPLKRPRASYTEAKHAASKPGGIERRITKCRALVLGAPDDRTKTRLEKLIADLKQQLGVAANKAALSWRPLLFKPVSSSGRYCCKSLFGVANENS